MGRNSANHQFILSQCLRHWIKFDYRELKMNVKAKKIKICQKWILKKFKLILNNKIQTVTQVS